MRTTKVLIVDDNANDRKLLRLNLERHGYNKVIEAGDGQEGIDLAMEHRPDLIISDALMPRMDGFELLRALKINEELRNTPFVFHSSVYTGQSDEELAAHLGAEAFLTKPKEPEELWKEIAAILERIESDGKIKLPAEPIKGETEFLKEYSEVVAAKLQLKIKELEESLSRREEAEKALRGSERFLNSIIENIPAMIFVKDASDLRFIRFNKAGEELLGYSREELIGKTDHDLFPPDEADFFTAGDREVIRNGRLLDIPENIVQTRLKGPRTLHTKKLPITDEDGVPQYLLGISEDITELKKLEDQLRHSQKLEAVGTLAGGIAHDFNNILTAIVGYGQLTLMKIPHDDPVRLNVEHILESAERAAALTQSLLAFSRKQISERKPVELNTIVRKVEKFLIRVIGEDVAIHLNLAEREFPILADAGQLEQVFMNLATNARDAMPQGGSFLIKTSCVELDNSFIAAHGYGKTGSYVIISVADTGTGMSEATKEKIFEPFFTTKEVGKGTGLGLAMAYGIIKQHEGFINVYSVPGEGTTMHIYLPLIKSSPKNGEKTAEEPYPQGGTETILLAEDDPHLQPLSVMILQQMGYRVITADNGEEAVAKFMENREKIQLLLLDIIMPKKSGREAADEIRRVDPTIPVLFISGYSSELLREKGLIEEDAAMINKPMTPNVLLKKVREILDKGRTS